MSRASFVTWAAVAAGLVAASAFAVARAEANHGILAIWGFVGLLDFALPAAAGALGGAVLGLLLRPLFRGGGAPRIARRILVGALVVEALLLAAFAWVLDRNDPTRLPPRPAPAGPRPPDIVVVIYDAVRADIVTDERGAIPDWAPRLKRLADGGVRFRQAVAPAPWTVPSHASLFTGLSPLDHGAMEESPHLAEEIDTLAETLRSRGYRTVGIVANPWLDRANGFGQGFENYFELWRMDAPQLIPLLYRATGRFERDGRFETGDPRNDKGARLMNALARRTLARLRDDEPLFLFVNLVDAHPPYWAPPSDRFRLVPEDLRAKGITTDTVPQNMPAIYTGKVTISDDQRRLLRGLNMGEVAYMDRHLGQLLDDLEEAGRFRRSVFAVTSDHGAGLGEDRLFGSGFDLRESMIRIPMIVHLPDGASAGTMRDDLVFLHDLHPTILALAGCAGDADETPDASRTDARNGRPLLAGVPRTGGLAAYTRPVNMLRLLHDADPEFDAAALDRKLLALRGPRYKFIWSSAGNESLFDLANQGEREDLAAAETQLKQEQASLLQRMIGGDFEEICRRALAQALHRHAAEAGMDAETLEMLKKLGY